MLHKRHLIRKEPVVTRSMSHSSFMLKSDSHISCFQGVVDDSLKIPPKFQVHHCHDPSKSNQSGRIEKRAGMSTAKEAFRKSKPTLARLDSIQRLFHKIYFDDDSSPEDVCNFCKSNNKFLYNSESTEEPQGECECAVMKPESPIAKVVSKTSPVPPCSPIRSPVRVPELGFSTASGPFKCSVTDTFTGMEWNPRGRILQAVLGALTGLHYWTVTGTRTGRRVYMFGYFTHGEWRYVTVSSNKRKIRFQTNRVPPKIVNVDDEKVTDYRAFNLEGDPDSAYLIPATMNNHYVMINTQHRRKRIELTEDKSLAFKWRLID